MCFVEIAQLEHKRHNFGINLGAIPLGSRSGAVRGPFGGRSGAVRAGFDDLYLERMILAILFDRSPAL